VASDMTTASSGEMIIAVGEIRIRLPRSFPTRSSPDGKVHICFVVDESRIPVAKCLFVPGNV
jgi:hypothetical protein